MTLCVLLLVLMDLSYRPLLLSKILNFFVCFSQSLWHFTSTERHSVILHMKIYALHVMHCFRKSDFSKKIVFYHPIFHLFVKAALLEWIMLWERLWAC